MFPRAMGSVFLSLVISCTLWLLTSFRSTLQDALHTAPVTYTDFQGPPILSGTPASLSSLLFPHTATATYWTSTGANNRALQALFLCIETRTCGQNQMSVIVLHSHYFSETYSGFTGGEHIWARSMILSWQRLGATVLYADNVQHCVALYNIVPSLVKMVISQEQDGPEDCIRDERSCLLSPSNEFGIPIYKIFHFHFWTGVTHPLGGPWTLSPDKYELEGWIPNTYVGYSVEPNCRSTPFIPHGERNNSAYILAKLASYFTEKSKNTWPPEFYDAAEEATDINFVMGTMDDSAEREETPAPPKHAQNLGLLNPAQFIKVLSSVRVLVGIGMPLASPTPYDALCLGVPFINPISDWDKSDPTNRHKWSVQHGLLKFLDPPYVYNVFKGDRDGFVSAIRNALAHPIDSYILDRMELSAIDERMQAILDTNWHERAQAVVAQRMESGKGQVFVV